MNMTMLNLRYGAFLLCLCFLTTAMAKESIVGRHCQGQVRHVHIAVGKNSSTTMTVSFSSKQSTYHPESPPIGAVLVGTRPNELTQVFVEKGLPLSYNASLPRVKENIYYSPFQHHVLIKNLLPNTKYYYQCIARDSMAQIEELQRLGSEVETFRSQKKVASSRPEEHLWHDGDSPNNFLGSWKSEDEYEESQDDEEFLRRRRQLDPYDPSRGSCPNPHAIRSFRTAPIPGQQRPDKTIKFAILADLGQFEHSIETVGHLQKHRFEYDAVLIAGDIAYTDLDPRRWDTFFDFMDDFRFWDEIPTMVAPGNHDVDKTRWASDIFQPYERRFRMPRVHSPQLGVYERNENFGMETVPYPLPYEFGNSYYDFVYGPSHHIVMNSYAAMEPESTQYKWLVRTLDAVDRAVTPWLFVTFHVPIYNTYRDHQGDIQRLVALEHIEPLLVHYKANMVFSGHVHGYSRTVNVTFTDPTPTGPMHVVVGHGGRNLKAKFHNENPEEWIASRDATVYGYGSIEILNRTHARWDRINVGEGEEHYNQVWKKRGLRYPAERKDTVLLVNQYYQTELSG